MAQGQVKYKFTVAQMIATSPVKPGSLGAALAAAASKGKKNK